MEFSDEMMLALFVCPVVTLATFVPRLLWMLVAVVDSTFIVDTFAITVVTPLIPDRV
jgi:hypothetical protein